MISPAQAQTDLAEADAIASDGWTAGSILPSSVTACEPICREHASEMGLVPLPPKAADGRSLGPRSGCRCSGYANKHGFGAHCKDWEYPGQTPWCYVDRACSGASITAGGSFGEPYDECVAQPAPATDASAGLAATSRPPPPPPPRILAPPPPPPSALAALEKTLGQIAPGIRVDSWRAGDGGGAPVKSGGLASVGARPSVRAATPVARLVTPTATTATDGAAGASAADAAHVAGAVPVAPAAAAVSVVPAVAAVPADGASATATLVRPAPTRLNRRRLREVLRGAAGRRVPTLASVGITSQAYGSHQQWVVLRSVATNTFVSVEPPPSDQAMLAHGKAEVARDAVGIRPRSHRVAPRCRRDHAEITPRSHPRRSRSSRSSDSFAAVSSGRDQRIRC